MGARVRLLTTLGLVLLVHVRAIPLNGASDALPPLAKLTLGARNTAALVPPAVRAWPLRAAYEAAARLSSPVELAREAALRTREGYAAMLRQAKSCPGPDCTAVFIHVPKTGGTSLFLALLDYTNRTGLGFARCMHAVTPARCVVWSGGEAVAASPASLARVLVGHMPLALDARVLGGIPRQRAVLAILREPVSRLVSFYNFRRPPASFDTWYASSVRAQACNLMTAYMAGALAGPETVYGGDCSRVTRADLHRAQHRAATFVTVLGLQHRYAEAVATVGCFFSLDEPARLRLTIGHIAPHEQPEAPVGFVPVTADALSPGLVAQIREDNALDEELVQYVETLLDARAADTAAAMESRCPKMMQLFLASRKERLAQTSETARTQASEQAKVAHDGNTGNRAAVQLGGLGQPSSALGGDVSVEHEALLAMLKRMNMERAD